MLKIAVAGCTGEMGRRVIREILGRDDVSLAGATGKCNLEHAIGLDVLWQYRLQSCFVLFKELRNSAASCLLRWKLGRLSKRFEINSWF